MDRQSKFKKKLKQQNNFVLSSSFFKFARFCTRTLPGTAGVHFFSSFTHV